jgi:hypothetical protein
MSGLKLENEVVSDDTPPSDHEQAKELIEETLGELEGAVNRQITGMTVRRSVQGLVVNDRSKPAPVAPDRGPLK